MFRTGAFILLNWAISLGAQVQFTSSGSKGCEPLIVDFKDQTPNAAQWKWDLGNGNTSSLKNPAASYLSGKYNITLTTWDAAGNLIGTTTKSNLVEVYKEPSLNFSVNYTSICVGAPVTFTMNSAGAAGLSGYFWDFGDGSTYSGMDASHAWNQTGFYNISVKAKDSNGCEGSTTKPNLIQVVQGPSMQITTQPYYACEPPLLVSFRELTNTGFTSFWWSFGDGSNSAQKEPDHNYTKYGTFAVELKAADNQGCVKTIPSQVQIISLDNIAMNFSTDYLCKPGEISFGVNGPHPFHLFKMDWDFGDNTPHDYSIFPKHKFNAPGSYLVTLVISFGNCTKTITKTIEVSPDPEPKVRGKVSQFNYCAPISLELVDSAFDKKHYWSSTVLNFIITADSWTKKFQSAPDNYFHDSAEVYLTYKYGKNDGCMVSKKFMVYSSAPKFSFKDSVKNEGCLRRTFYFSATKIWSQSPATITWSENGTTLHVGESFEHTFSEAGQHIVDILVVDSNGCKSAHQLKVNAIIVGPEANIVTDVLYVNCPPAICRFQADFLYPDQVDTMTILWKFGDGDSGFVKNPTHMYNNSGEFDVTLYFKDLQGCEFQKTIPAFIHIDGPRAALKASSVASCAPLLVPFEVYGTHKVRRYILDFGDGSYVLDSVAKKFTHSYNDAGTKFTPQLILFDSMGCKNAVKATVNLTTHPLPESDFVYSEPCATQAMLLQSQYGLKGHTKTTGNWFMDGVWLGNVAWHYAMTPKPGYRNVKLVAKNEFGCMDSTSRKIKVYSLEALTDKEADTACAGNIITFKGLANSDTTLVSGEWRVNGVKAQTGYQFDSIFTTAGKRNLSFIVTNAAGCRHEVLKENAIVVGDTQSPVPPRFMLVTRLDNQTDELQFERTASDDFRNYIIWDADNNTIIDSIADINQLKYSRQYPQPQGSQCYMVGAQNLCYKFSNKNALEKHCTIEVQLKPDTNKIDLNWNAYMGWQDSLDAYVVQRADYPGGTNFVTLDVISGEKTNYTDTTVVCKRSYSYRIIANSAHQNLRASFSDTSIGKAPHKNPLPELYPYLVSTLDNNQLELRYSPFNASKGSVDRIVLYTSTDQTAYQFYDTLFMPKDSASVLKIEANRQYFLRSDYFNSCDELSKSDKICSNIFLQFSGSSDAQPQLNWTSYNYWPNGVAKYLVQRKEGKGVYKTLAEIAGNAQRNYRDTALYSACREDLVYRIAAVPNPAKIGMFVLQDTLYSYSNRVSWLGTPLAYIPNAFTPNNNNLNDVFRPVCVMYKHYELNVYSRWGERIYASGETCTNGWDGRREGHMLSNGVYGFTLKVIGLDGKEYRFRGTVHLLR